MKQILTAFFVLLCCPGMAQQPNSIPEKFRGNWLQTDGSNEFILGLYAKQVAFKSRVWELISLQENESGTTIQIKGGNITRSLTLQQTAPNRLLVKTPDANITLSNILTWNYQHQPPATALSFQTNPNGKATIRGLLVKKEKDVSVQNTVAIYYQNPYTFEKELFFTEADALGSFEISIPVYAPTWLEVVFSNETKQNLFVAPGSETLLVSNNNIIPGDAQNPDYNKVAQRNNYMGSLAAFNSGFLHYSSYKQTLAQLPEGLTKGEKFGLRKDYLLRLLHKGRATLAAIYSPRRFDPLLSQYVQEDFTFSLGNTFLEGMGSNYLDGESYNYSPTREDFKQFADTFFAKETAMSACNPTYQSLVYNLRGKYTNVFHRSGTYRVDDMIGEIEKRYKAGEYALSDAPIEHYIDITKKLESRRNDNEKELIKEFFNNDMDEVKRYTVIMRELRQQLFAESEDTAKYAIAKAALPTPQSRRLAGMQHLLNSSYDKGYPINRYRMEKFRLSYPEIPPEEFTLFEQLNTQYSLNMITGAMSLKSDSNRFRNLVNERDFQEIMKTHRGKTVVTIQFPHYYEKFYTEKTLFQIKQMEKHYRDSNVVFLKMIKARNRSDRDENIRKYLMSLKRADALNNACYMEDSVSVFYNWYLGWNGATYMQVYDTAGKIHISDQNMRESNNVSMQNELSKVLAGKGAFYEPLFPRILIDRSYEIGGWIRSFQSPPYYSFVRRYKRDMREDDSLFVRFQFLPDSSYREYAEKRKKGSYTPNIVMYTTVALKYQFNVPKREISIFTATRKLYKKFRLVFIGPDSMCLELLEEHPEVLGKVGK
jgi:hypothetical protein